MLRNPIIIYKKHFMSNNFLSDIKHMIYVIEHYGVQRKIICFMTNKKVQRKFVYFIYNNDTAFFLRGFPCR